MKYEHVKNKEHTILTNKMRRGTRKDQYSILVEECENVQHALERLAIACKFAGIKTKILQKDLNFAWSICDSENIPSVERTETKHEELIVNEVHIPICKANKDLVRNSIVRYVLKRGRGYLIFENEVRTLFGEETRQFAVERYDAYSQMRMDTVERIDNLINLGVLASM